ncbi:hypothetical protein NMY22_g10929 [Coprinellus aureogranulatus]|nr:hypothetical protein NMY22_g10929 [Coprinellus aureogranulatus]
MCVVVASEREHFPRFLRRFGFWRQDSGEEYEINEQTVPSLPSVLRSFQYRLTYLVVTSYRAIGTYLAHSNRSTRRALRQARRLSGTCKAGSALDTPPGPGDAGPSVLASLPAPQPGRGNLLAEIQGKGVHVLRKTDPNAPPPGARPRADSESSGGATAAAAVGGAAVGAAAGAAAAGGAIWRERLRRRCWRGISAWEIVMMMRTRTTMIGIKPRSVMV